jgi:uncharacterized protein (TIGR03084 family)
VGPSVASGQQCDAMEQICGDLTAEHDDLELLLSGLDEAGWSLPTPAAGWSIRDQVSHLWFFDQRALLALTDVAAFEADKQVLLAGGGTDASVVPGRSMTGGDLLDAWRHDRAVLVDTAQHTDPAARIPWYGPSMGARSFITARLMETWAHGQDVADTLGRQRIPTRRLSHVCHIGVRARPFSYAIRGLAVPDVEVAVRLQGPDGDVWTWGPESDDELVTGSALDFCLVVTQRRHRDDTDLVVRGDAASEWIDIAQAFAGAPGQGRTAGQFA